jgi:hypothetical protein
MYVKKGLNKMRSFAFILLLSYLSPHTFIEIVKQQAAADQSDRFINKEVSFTMMAERDRVARGCLFT